MLLVQLSDLHYLPPGRRVLERIDTAAALAHAVAAVNVLRPVPDAVLITGDLTHDGDRAAHLALHAALAELTAPILPLPGNHDDRELLRATFAATGLFAAEGPLSFVRELGPCRLIGLDSLLPGRPAGQLGAAQLAWLDQRLAESPRPTLVALHHPPFATGIEHMDRMMLLDAAELGAVLARHDHVVRVLSGHVHRTVLGTVGGRPAMIGPGTAHAVELTLADDPPRWIMEPPGMLLHHWQPAQGLASQLHCIGSFAAGPF